MKKLVALLLALSMVVALAACGENKETEAQKTSAAATTAAETTAAPTTEAETTAAPTTAAETTAAPTTEAETTEAEANTALVGWYSIRPWTNGPSYSTGDWAQPDTDGVFEMEWDLDDGAYTNLQLEFNADWATVAGTYNFEVVEATYTKGETTTDLAVAKTFSYTVSDWHALELLPVGTAVNGGIIKLTVKLIDKAA